MQPKNYCSKPYADKTLMWMEVHIHSVKAKSGAGKIRVKDMTTQKDQNRKKIS